MQEWTVDTLWAKGKAYLAQAFSEDRDGERFPFYATLGLVFVARAVLAKRHPVLLADPQDGENILYACGLPATAKPKSIPAATVLRRLRLLIDTFSEQDIALCTLLFDLRNRELHTGELAFQGISTGQWIVDFYRVLTKLVEHLGYKLSDIIGADEANAAAELIAASLSDKTAEVKKRIGQLKGKIGILSANELEERRKAHAFHLKNAIFTSGLGSFSSCCPCCASTAFITGRKIGVTPERIVAGEVKFQTIYSPIRFECKVCGLTLEGYEELRVEGLGDQIINDDVHDPVEYFNIDVEDYIDMDEIRRRDGYDEYGNE
jgi:hypothetical protein